MVTSRVAAVAGRNAIAESRLSPASRRTTSWLWPGAKSTTCEEWPACGGSTSVGTTSVAIVGGGEVVHVCERGAEHGAVREVPLRDPAVGHAGPPPGAALDEIQWCRPARGSGCPGAA